ncbi:paralemmin 1a isoform X1 [Takifugu flavidus]|uniref:Paralemmin-1 n=1 Tax=Takifugu bimaculatus TaxID=433685 RepID=A0A4Z2B787_9TELE|nr:paralemmin 1a isoform X1 [Takifugu flavidus]TNM88112.1 hypothetical protein fugu_006333 [Takifugu bimaculatus]
MQVGETVCPQDRLHLLSEKRKWQSELENKRRQLEDDRRALQHMKMKAVREQWLLDGAASSGALDQDQARTRSLEETITRLENELLHLEAGGVSSGTLPAVEVKGRDDFEDDAPIPGFAEVNVNKSLMMKTPNEVEQLKRAMYSVEITVERDRVTGETRVLSTNTILPVDLSHQGVVVYEDERKVVHEMNGEDGVQPLSSSEVEQLIHKADEAFMMSPTSSMAASPPTVEVQEEAAPQLMPPVPVEATRLETSVDLQLSAAEASDENPVTMVFMGYQNVEDEDETKKVLGLQEMVKAELVLINDATTPSDEGKEEISLLPPALPRPPKPVEAEPPAQAAPEPEQPRAGATELKKEKRLCICCSIM